MDDKVLPLQALGTGISEVVMIAAFCTISEGEIICIEEPELHLHPILQKKLLAYLRDETKNQYFIATHSASLIDLEEAKIFHVWNEEGGTKIRASNIRYDKYKIFNDLGHRASDILQSNAIIWVEGPSDRLYINHWLNHWDGRFVEGIHYSIMFYGGRLLSHVSADQDEVNGLIDLHALNRNLAIVIDSDKSCSSDAINPTKKRLRDAFNTSSGFCWITAGREIENYIPFDALQSAVKEVHRVNYGNAIDGGPFSHALHYHRLVPKKGGKRNTRIGEAATLETEIRKVAVASIVCSQEPKFEVLDLRQRMKQLADFVASSN